jgi:hypothetical protein
LFLLAMTVLCFVVIISGEPSLLAALHDAVQAIARAWGEKTLTHPSAAPPLDGQKLLLQSDMMYNVMTSSLITVERFAGMTLLLVCFRGSGNACFRMIQPKSSCMVSSLLA